jgi:Cytidylate kinase-like family
MAKVSLAEHMKEQRGSDDEGQEQAGPFVTISREFGCYGFSLGLLLMEILNDDVEPGGAWRIYHREILERLATETNMATELLERQRRTRPRLLGDFFRSLSKDKAPSGQQIRKRITMIIRGLAIDGRAIVIGQGGTAATLDLPNRMAVRLEAPLDWRVKEVAFREGLSETKAKLRIQAKDHEREYLRKLYSARFQNKPSFNLVYDCSTFTLAQIAQHVVYGMRLRGLI